MSADAALVAIDLQRGFDEPPWREPNNPRLEANVAALFALARRLRRPLIHVQHDSVAPDSPLRPERPGHGFRPGCEPLAGEPVVHKSVNAAFIGTDLELRLRRLGCRSLYVFGISTDMCVSTTARMASNLGFDVSVIADACRCFALTDADGRAVDAETVHRVHLATLAFEFGRVVSTADVLGTLEAAGGGMI